MKLHRERILERFFIALYLLIVMISGLSLQVQASEIPLQVQASEIPLQQGQASGKQLQIQAAGNESSAASHLIAGNCETVAGSSTFYQKLQNGENVRIACLGDSISAGAGATDGIGFVHLIQQWIQQTYGCHVTMDNYSSGGTTTFFGYYRCETDMQANIERDGAYDLVIICYGRNDGADQFSLIYESLLSSVKKQNPNCQIITILEHCMDGYRDKIQAIKKLSKRYGADVVNAIEAYKKSGHTYEALSYDEVHPNDAGHMVYCRAIAAAIDTCVKNNKQVSGMPKPSDSNIAMFENFSFVSLSDCEMQDGVYTIPVNQSTVGIFYRESPESADICLDFSTGDTWNTPAQCEEDMVVLRASLVNLCVPDGTLISLNDQDGKIQNTIYGFILAGN